MARDLPAPAQDCRVAIVRAPLRAVTRRKERCKDAPAPALSSRPPPCERTDAPRATARPHCQLEPIAFRTGQPIDEIRIPFDYNFLRQQNIIERLQKIRLFSF